LSAACPFGKWPWAVTARGIRALTDSSVGRADDAANLGVEVEEGHERFSLNIVDLA
jgi:hypothetical protein